MFQVWYNIGAKLPMIFLQSRSPIPIALPDQRLWGLWGIYSMLLEQTSQHSGGPLECHLSFVFFPFWWKGNYSPLPQQLPQCFRDHSASFRDTHFKALGRKSHGKEICEIESRKKKHVLARRGEATLEVNMPLKRSGLVMRAVFEWVQNVNNGNSALPPPRIGFRSMVKRC